MAGAPWAAPGTRVVPLLQLVNDDGADRLRSTDGKPTFARPQGAFPQVNVSYLVGMDGSSEQGYQGPSIGGKP